MFKRPAAILAGIVINSVAIAQLYPSNLLWNGCAYNYNSFKTGDSVNCPDLTYKLVFEDNFDSTGLDKNKWQTFYPWGRSLHSSYSGTGWERQYYADENVSVANGNLQLLTKVDPGIRGPEPATQNIFFNYTSGMVFSLQGFTKGKFEARCKIPRIIGMFPAFWLYSHCAQEIDIFEFINSSKTSDPAVDGGHVIMTYHRRNDCADTSKGTCSSGFTRNYDRDLSADFHVFSMEWNEEKMIWRVDGEVAREVYRLWNIEPSSEMTKFSFASPVRSCNELSPATSYSEFDPFPVIDNRMHLIINTAVLERGGEEGALPQQFLIDYVRVYEEVEGEPKVIINDLSDFNVFPNPTTGAFFIPAFILGRPVEEVTIFNSYGQKLHLKAKSEEGTLKYVFDDLPKGLYIVKIFVDSKVYIRKIIYN